METVTKCGVIFASLLLPFLDFKALALCSTKENGMPADITGEAHINILTVCLALLAISAKFHVFPLCVGTKYVGEFKNGMFHGHGSLHMEGGTLYVAEWENGKV
jgi:hypothetical protein